MIRSRRPCRTKTAFFLLGQPSRIIEGIMRISRRVSLLSQSSRERVSLSLLGHVNDILPIGWRISWNVIAQKTVCRWSSVSCSLQVIGSPCQLAICHRRTQGPTTNAQKCNTISAIGWLSPSCSNLRNVHNEHGKCRRDIAHNPLSHTFDTVWCRRTCRCVCSNTWRRRSE